MKELLYKSTRGEAPPVRAAEAVIKGLASDGGLFVPETFPSPDWKPSDLTNLTYQELALRVMQPFLPDFSSAELRECIVKAYDANFDTPQIAPLVSVDCGHFLELYHGPTLAFKDMALTILPHLLLQAAGKLDIDSEIVILTATSGDTGKAALEGFSGADGTRIIVFYPENGVSAVQKRQMVTQRGENTHVIAVRGNFDDCQRGVKAVFGDAGVRASAACRRMLFSSANSINIGRLIPQVVYYFSAYLQLMKKGAVRPGDEVNFAVPTGNFGNILAAWYAKKMGLPVRKLLCAANENKVLADFLTRGVYDKNRPFYVTMSPSMDILVSSNLERLLYEVAGEDGLFTGKLMKQLDTAGRYEVNAQVLASFGSFFGGHATEEETLQAISDVFASSAYLMDPHTAVAWTVWRKYRQQTADNTPAIIVSTASPYKFPGAVLQAVSGRYQEGDDIYLLRRLSELTGTPVPPAIELLDSLPVLHHTVCRQEEMRSLVVKILGL
jgi:threonine synthase